MRIDEKKVKRFTDKFTEEYPYGELIVDRDNLFIQIRCRLNGNIPLCLKCGGLLINRVNQYKKNGEWHQKARKDNITNWECPKCYPNGHAPLVVAADIEKN